MTNLGRWLVGVTCSLFLGACGPLPEGEEELDADSSDVTDDAEIGTVHQETLGGDLGSNMGQPVVIYPTTCTATNQWHTTCGTGSSRDVAYVWKVPATGTYSFSTRNSNYDTVMEIRNYKATSEVLKCNDDTGSLYTSAISLSGLIKGTQLLIIIEGYDGDCGNTHLNITKR